MMLVANSFDLWQKDTFFSAAEEVQQSSDIMESAYRTWERQKREGLTFEYLDELCRELQTALGTAKWQLEEFEKAVRLSYRNHIDEVTMVRHRQFVDCIGNQISRVEAALRDSFSEQGEQPLRWVKLDEEECNDLAAFLSGSPGTSQTMKDELAKFGAFTNSSLEENHCMKEERCHSIKAACGRNSSYQANDCKDVLANNKDAKCIIDLEAKEIHGTRDDIKSGTRRNWSSPDIGAWKIVIPDEDDGEKALIPNNEDTPKDKGSKHVLWRQRHGDRPQAKGGILSYSQFRVINRISQIMGRVGGCQRQLQTPVHVQFSSVWFKLALVLTVFLIVPFVLYST